VGLLQPSSTAGSRQEISHLLFLTVSAPVNGRVLFNLAPAGG